jgi:hypothetical protein
MTDTLRRDHRRWGASSWALVTCVATSACIGTIGDRDEDRGPDEPSGGGTTEVTPEVDLTAKSGLRRLTVHEYNSVLRDLLYDGSAPAVQQLPEDVHTPFDNDYTNQHPSSTLILGAEILAADSAAALLTKPAKRDLVVGCAPAGPDDSECFRSFVESFGRRALRRRLSAPEVDRFAELQSFGVTAGDFYVGVDTALRAFLQHPEFLYRVEIGTPVAEVPGLFRLSDWEVATRLSFLVWGSAPDDWLLDLAEAGQLRDPEQVRAVAVEMLADPRARATVSRFHALWMGYEQTVIGGELGAAMQEETSALLSRVIFEEERGWQEIFTAEETFVGDMLAEHYGMSLPQSADPVWTSYQGTGRKGILSHGTFLSSAAKFDDTSPTMRGLAIRTRLFCQVVPPPPQDVPTDDPPPETEEAVCKWDRYEMHRQGGCAGCHSLMDPVGFGLENYDREGKYRTHDIGHPECPIDGIGELAGIGAFEGPAGLAELMVESGLLNRCVSEQLYRYAVGRSELEELDRQFIDLLVDRVANAQSFRFSDLLLEIVSSESFGYRREDPGSTATGEEQGQ